MSLQIESLSVAFGQGPQSLLAVQDLSLGLEPGQTLGVVGESGCGKSTLALAIMGLLPAAARVTGGRVRFDGQTLIDGNQRYPSHLRGRRLAMVFQDPMTSLNPYLSIEAQFRLPLRRHLKLSRSQARARTIELLRTVGIPDPEERLGRHAHEFSGGQRQRLGIALALCCDPELLIADEPTTALDVTIQAGILSLLRDLQQQRRLGLLLITHDLGVVAQMCQEVMVMYAGRCVERASAEALFAQPQHPYTKALLAAVPRLDSEPGSALANIPGQPPRITSPSHSCPFAPRCRFAEERCQQQLPQLLPCGPGHQAACLLLPQAGPAQAPGDAP
ncbi:MAG: ABC transporter ATP-binding protein [Planctomycetota bacterium]|nr:MAG: ABC transporter ATP-binding protein [Planctomycetota bacterium]